MRDILAILVAGLVLTVLGAWRISAGDGPFGLASICYGILFTVLGLAALAPYTYGKRPIRVNPPLWG